MWKRRAALGMAVGVVGAILALSTLGAEAFGGRCTVELCFVPGSEVRLAAGLVLGVLGGIVAAWGFRGRPRNDPSGK